MCLLLWEALRVWCSLSTCQQFLDEFAGKRSFSPLLSELCDIRWHELLIFLHGSAGNSGLGLSLQVNSAFGMHVSFYSSCLSFCLQISSLCCVYCFYNVFLVHTYQSGLWLLSNINRSLIEVLPPLNLSDLPAQAITCI